MSSTQWFAKAQDALDAAYLLLGQGYADSAASRAYYGCFFVATALMSGDAAPLRRHRQVMSQLAIRFTQSGLIEQRFHSLLITAFAARQAADYTIERSPDHETIAALIVEGRDGLTAARACVDPG